MLDIVPGRDDRAAVDEMVVELGDLLGYVRVSARALAHTAAPGLLATLPPQVPVALGGAEPGAGADLDVPGHIARAVALRDAVDAMLRHPQATRS